MQTVSNKISRPNYRPSNNQKEVAFNLYLKNINQKEISKQLGVTEKTIGKWAKVWKLKTVLTENTIINLKNKLFEYSTNPETSPEAIKNLVWSIQQLEKSNKNL